MDTINNEKIGRAVLFERRELPPPARDQANCIHSTLQTLAADGEIGGVERAEWVKRTPIEEFDSDLRDTYLSLQAWADREGVRLTPFFQTRECFSPEAGERTDWLVLPAFCLALYGDEGVTAVYPHSDGGETKTVCDGLQALLADDIDDVAPELAHAD